MTRRATLRGAERTSLDGESADVLVCGASFAGLAVARELAGSGADVLLVDRYEVGERATSACAAPRPWLEAMGVAGSIRQEIPCMSFHTPHGSVRYRLPWSWAAFDYRELCQQLSEQTDARFEIATVSGRRDGGVLTDRGMLRAPLVVDALGWRRVLAGESNQPPEAPLSRGLEVHPDGGGRDLDAGSTARSSATATAGASRQAASSGWAWAPTSPVITCGPDGGPRGAAGAGAGATRATGSRIGSGAPPRTACSSRATRPGTASPSPARAFEPRSTSASPAAASCDRCSRGSEPGMRHCAATRGSARRTAGPSGWRCDCSGSCRTCRHACSRSLYARSPVRRWWTAPSAGT